MSNSPLTARLRSFRYAFAGVRTLFATQANFRIHAVAALVVVATGALLHVSQADWLWLTAAIVGVWVTEAFNTALEFLADAVATDPHPLIGKAKDCAAAAVLLAAFGAVIIGLLVLGPPLIRLLAGGAS
jgi:diacylglycerol kinase (ATP)